MSLRKRLIAVLSTFILIMGILPSTAFADDAITTDVVIHKLKVDTGTALKDHDGKEINPDGLKTISGVEFKYWSISKSATAEQMAVISGLKTIGAIETYAAANPSALTGGTTTGATGADGSVTVSGLAEGKYIFGEVNGAAHNVAEYIGVPFLLELPAMHTDGSGYFGTGENALHVYPKNVVSDGELNVKTIDKKTEAQISGGEFSFALEASANTWVTVTGFDAGLVVSTGYSALKDLPAGKYRLTNTKAPAGYMLDNRPVYFTVSAGTVTADTSENPNAEFKATGGVAGDPLIVIKFEKNPEVKKTVDGAKEKSYQVGNAIPWSIDLEIPSGIADYAQFDLVDNIDTRLDFLGNVSIKLSDGTPLVVDTHYTYSYVPGATSTDKGVFKIVFDPESLTGYAGKTIVATYQTTINETAGMGEVVNNAVQLDFNNGHGAVTDPKSPIVPKDTPGVWTGGAKFKKVNDGSDPLAGAEFKIASDVAGTVFVKWTAALIEANQTGIAAGLFVTPVVGQDVVMVSGTNGSFEIKGLAEATYALVETKAPTVGGVQYNLMKDPASFVIDKTSYQDTNSMQVINKSGLQIPQTGGIGTAIFTIIGISLMGLAVFLLRKKKKTESPEIE